MGGVRVGETGAFPEPGISGCKSFGWRTTRYEIVEAMTIMMAG